MTFLERFKGKTNFITREGIASLISEASIPVEKIQDQILNSRKKKSNTISYNNHRPPPIKVKTSIDTIDKMPAASDAFSTPIKKNISTPLRVQENIERKHSKSSTSVGLQLSSDRNAFQKESHYGFSPKLHYYTPQHKFSPLKEPLSADGWTFSNRVKNIKSSYPRIISPASSTMKSISSILDKKYDSPSIKTTSSMKSLPGTSVAEQGRINKFMYDFDQDKQDQRLAIMNFMQNQERLISKYRHQSSNVESNRSMDFRSSYILSPKLQK